MKNVMHQLKKMDYSIVIISDANTVYIHTILEVFFGANEYRTMAFVI
jgi:hypothetical protein